MTKNLIEVGNLKIPYIENNVISEKILIFIHGLDGTASFSKPLFKSFTDIKVVAIEQRGHMNSPMPASRSIKKHVNDFLTVINHFRSKGYKDIYIFGESMGASYSALLSRMDIPAVKHIFAQSIPNKLVNLMQAPKTKQSWIQFMTVLSFVTNINYSYKADINYEQLSNNNLLHRLARLDNKNKKRQLRETLSTWAVNKKAWRILKNKKPIIPFTYFAPDGDVLCEMKKSIKNFNKNFKDQSFVIIPNSKHILMYEDNNFMVFDNIKKTIHKDSNE